MAWCIFDNYIVSIKGSKNLKLTLVTIYLFQRSYETYDLYSGMAKTFSDVSLNYLYSYIYLIFLRYTKALLHFEGFLYAYYNHWQRFSIDYFCCNPRAISAYVPNFYRTKTCHFYNKKGTKSMAVDDQNYDPYCTQKIDIRACRFYPIICRCYIQILSTYPRLWNDAEF